MLQPYPDGVSSRRTTVTSLLAHGCAVVTTRGPLTEGLWQESGAVDVVAPTPAELAQAVMPLLARLNGHRSGVPRASCMDACSASIARLRCCCGDTGGNPPRWPDG